MSEHDDEMPVFHSPQELVEHMRQHQIAHRMHTVDNTHLVNDLIYKLDEEGLRALDLIICHTADDPRTAGFFRGQISARLQTDFGLCPCGDNHGDISSLTGDEQQPGNIDPLEDVRNQLDEEAKPERTRDEVVALMKQYNLEYDEDPDTPYIMKCKGCGKGSVSLDDRMLRAPDACTGCHEKSAWG